MEMLQEAIRLLKEVKDADDLLRCTKKWEIDMEEQVDVCCRRAGENIPAAQKESEIIRLVNGLEALGYMVCKVDTSSVHGTDLTVIPRHRS
jgi:hypothetical protein